MPVDRNSHSGVWRVARGSRITLFGIISRWPKLSLTWRAVSVQPAEAVYSPADSVVGIAIVRTDGGRDCGRTILPSAPTTALWLSSSPGSLTSLPRQNATIFAASVTEPPPSVTRRSALAARAALAPSLRLVDRPASCSIVHRPARRIRPGRVFAPIEPTRAHALSEYVRQCEHHASTTKPQPPVAKRLCPRDGARHRGHPGRGRGGE